MAEVSQPTRRVYLAQPGAECEQEFLASAQGSERLHRPWVSAPANHENYVKYLDRIATGRTIPFLLRRTSDHRMTGVVNINEPVMGGFRSGYLGFYAFGGFERQGYMTEGLSLVLDRAFGELAFHRLEANIQPANAASTALIRRLGFRHEGFSPRYLFIDGDWRDHDRWTMLTEDWSQPRERLFASRRDNARQSRDA